METINTMKNPESLHEFKNRLDQLNDDKSFEKVGPNMKAFLAFASTILDKLTKQPDQTIINGLPVIGNRGSNNE